MQRGLVVITVIAIAAMLLMACGAQPGTPPAAPAGGGTPAPAAKPAWQQDWDQTVAAAKKEGKLVAITEFNSDGARTVADAFKEKYGIDMEFVIGRVSEIIPKVQTERRAGLYLEDIYLSGVSSIVYFKDFGYLDRLKPLLIVPEAIDPKAWMEGGVKFMDKDELMLAYEVQASPSIHINSDIVKPDEIKSYKDLLDPKWKGKIVVQDPSIGGAGLNFFFILWNIMGPQFTRDFAKQDLAITADTRQQGEWVARGKYPVSGNMSSDIRSQFLAAGAPIKVIRPVEGTVTSVSKSGLSIFQNAPHPNASKVFINWLLTKDAQTIVSKVTGDSSRRLDVARDWVNPDTVVQPGVNYLDSDSEDALKMKQELQVLCKEIWNIKK